VVVFLLGVLAAVIWSFWIQTMWWRAFVEDATNRQTCAGFPCFACKSKFTSLFAYIEGFSKACDACCTFT
jgi:hypothetical protein